MVYGVPFLPRFHFIGARTSNLDDVKQRHRNIKKWKINDKKEKRLSRLASNRASIRLQILYMTWTDA